MPERHQLFRHFRQFRGLKSKALVFGGGRIQIPHFCCFHQNAPFLAGDKNMVYQNHGFCHPDKTEIDLLALPGKLWLIFHDFLGSQKGGLGGCSPVPKTGTRVHSDVLTLSWRDVTRFYALRLRFKLFFSFWAIA